MYRNLKVPNYVPLPMKDEISYWDTQQNQSDLANPYYQQSHPSNNVNWENHPFSTIWPEQHVTQKNKIRRKEIDCKEKKCYVDKQIKGTILKKKKRFRTAFTTEQLRALEEVYRLSKYIDGDSRKKLAKRLNIADVSVKTWFQNRRMKEKREDAESSDHSGENPSLSSSIQNQQSNLYFGHTEGNELKIYIVDLLENQRSEDNTGTSLATLSPTGSSGFTNSNDYVTSDTEYKQNNQNSNENISPSYLSQVADDFNSIADYSTHGLLGNTNTFGYQLPSHQVSENSVNRDFLAENHMYPTQYYPVHSGYYSHNSQFYHVNNQYNW